MTIPPAQHDEVKPPSFWKQAWVGIEAAVRWLPLLLYKLMEGVTVLGVFWVAFYMAYWIIWGDVNDPRHVRMLALLGAINDNWKACLLLLIPLLFRTIRTFMEEVEKVGGMKRKKVGEGGQAQNPTAKP